MERTLLVLDDDLAVGTTICAIARSIGFTATAATDADRFLGLLAETAPSHVAVDLMMPGVDGIEILLELARRRCPSAIVITSGAGSRVLDAAQRSAAEHGLNVLGVVPKPFSADAFRTVLRRALAPVPSARAPQAAPPVTEAELRSAIDRRAISLVYQPKVACAGGRVHGFEALARWRDPDKGVISPEIFVPLAESAGLIDAFTELVCDEALTWFAATFGAGDLQIAINFSARTLADMGLPDRLEAMVRGRGLDPNRLVLELTETSALADPASTLSLATRLRLKGFQLAIDDFGVGYSSLVQLARLPFSELKVDMAFVRKIEHSEESRKIVGSIVSLGHSLDMRVVAEGVEDAAILAILADAGCDLAQGYFIAKPMPGEAVLGWMATRPRSLATVPA